MYWGLLRWMKWDQWKWTMVWSGEGKDRGQVLIIVMNVLFTALIFFPLRMCCQACGIGMIGRMVYVLCDYRWMCGWRLAGLLLFFGLYRLIRLFWSLGTAVHRKKRGRWGVCECRLREKDDDNWWFHYTQFNLSSLAVPYRSAYQRLHNEFRKRGRKAVGRW